MTGPKITKKINQDFFKKWSFEMAYVLGFFVADGCIMVSKGRQSNPYTFNITSVDLFHLEKIKKVLGSEYKIGKKSNGRGSVAYQISVRNSVLAQDLISLGIHPRKTYNLQAIKVPAEYFADFARGFFDGDGTVYIYKVNGTTQIKAGFVSVSKVFLNEFNGQLCRSLNIPRKSLHEFMDKKDTRMPKFNINFYVNDCQKFYEFIYKNATLFLDRKYEIFKKWEMIKSGNKKHYVKKNYPLKVGWHLNQKMILR